ncbi:MAG TPA: DinB family protein [Tepidisphaeraceae bacterium]|jgi:uncharacterized damage-inducible protein DinB
MVNESSLEILLKHDHWATAQLLGAAKSLSDSQLDQLFEMGMGSLRATLYHIVQTQWLWGESLSGREHDFEQKKMGIDELIAWHESVAAEFDRTVHATPLETPFNPPWKGKRYAFPRAGVITHILTHGMHHRAQALNMMRHLGVDPLPPSSVLQWMFMTGAGGEVK